MVQLWLIILCLQFYVDEFRGIVHGFQGTVKLGRMTQNREINEHKDRKIIFLIPFMKVCLTIIEKRLLVMFKSLLSLRRKTPMS